jgi:hypothetical protein
MEGKFNPEVRKGGDGFVFTKEMVETALEEAAGDVQIRWGEVLKLIPEKLYQGSKKSPQMFYWLQELKQALLKAGLNASQGDKIIRNFKAKIQALKGSSNV